MAIQVSLCGGSIGGGCVGVGGSLGSIGGGCVGVGGSLGSVGARVPVSGFIYDANTGGILHGELFEEALGSPRGVLFLQVRDSVRMERLLDR